METIIAIALALFLTQTPKEEVVVNENTTTVYNASDTRKSDIIHTDLEVSFDWAKQYLNGTATIKAKPYFHASNTLVLHAKGFDVHSVMMDNKDLKYSYDDFFLTIILDKEYTRDEDYTLVVKYTAKPNELNVKGSQAISDAKGLYFINPEGEGDVPQQIWTQGETVVLRKLSYKFINYVD